jgi:hypothetical protein
MRYRPLSQAAGNPEANIMHGRRKIQVAPVNAFRALQACFPAAPAAEIAVQALRADAAAPAWVFAAPVGPVDAVVRV